MKRKITQGLAAFAALGALALGGSAVAGAVQSNNATAPVVKQAPSKAQENTSGPDTDKVQSGDQTTPDTVNASSSSSSTGEAPGTEQSAASESSGSESSSESATANDGPGGHADEPGNANADHQAQGQE